MNEPVIGHTKSDGHLGRWHLKGREGDAINVILTAVGHNLRRVIAWLRALLLLNPGRLVANSGPSSNRQTGFLRTTRSVERRNHLADPRCHGSGSGLAFG